MKITIPELSLVVLIGPSGSGKSTFARKHFKPTEVLSSDYCRGLVSDDENSQAATNDAFDAAALHRPQAARGRHGSPWSTPPTCSRRRASRSSHSPASTTACPWPSSSNLPEKLCHERNHGRPDRAFGPHVVRQHSQQLRRSLRHLKDEGFRHVFVLTSPEEVEAAEIERQPLWNNLKHEHGPFDIIGDVHGCCDELVALLGQLGYVPSRRRRQVRRPPPAGPQGRLPRRPRRPRPRHARRAAPGDGHGRGRHGALRPRQPRHEADAQAPRAGTSRSRTAWPSRWRSSSASPRSSRSRSRPSSTTS